MEILNDINKIDINSDDIWNLIDSLEIEEKDTKELEVESCTNCKSINLYTDVTEGIIVCSDCGLKIRDILDRSPDWNSINSSNDHNSRCGCPTNYFFPQSSLGTKVSNGRYSRISILEKWSQMPYKERSRYEVLKYIETKCNKFNVSQPIIDNAKNLFNQLSKITTLSKDNKKKSIIIRGLNRKSIIAACVYNGANLQGKPRTPKEVAEIFGITEKQVTKGNRKFRDIMTKEKIVKNLKATQSAEYIDRKEYINLLKLENFQIEIAKKIAKNVKRLDIATDHQPASLAAGSVMLMANILNLNLSKKKISETFKISQVTIIKTFRKIYPYRKVLISNEATEKILKLAKKPIITTEDSETDNILNVVKETEEESDEEDEDDNISIDSLVVKNNKNTNLIEKYV
jgi:transcription initiation factor TFIIIB Brf1 subunit/transcription initiation factor TFIIB